MTTPPTKPFKPQDVIAQLRKSGTGHDKIRALLRIDADSKADWLEQASAVVPSGTMRKIQAIID